MCEAFELVLADGSIVQCSATERPELFYHVPWSYGTLGFLTAATIRIVPAKEYVKVTYMPFKNDQKGALDLFEAESRKGADDPTEAADFVEALAYSRTDYVVMTASMCDAPVGGQRKLINRIGLYWKPWFFYHVKNMLTTSDTLVEYIPLRHYYHRHTRSLFWEVEDIVPFGNDLWFRYLLGFTMPPKPSLLKITQTETTRRLYELHHVVQDMLVPIKDTAKSIDLFHGEFEVYPLWLCPMRIKKDGSEYGGLIKPLADGDEMFVDIGAYGNEPPGLSSHGVH